MPNKIQFKRGLKASLPDLDAGEPGYCTDTQELFIGNASGPNMQVASKAENARQIDQPLVGRQKTVKEDDQYNCWPILVKTITNRMISFYASGPSHKQNGGGEVAGRTVNYKISGNEGLTWGNEIRMLYAPDTDYTTFGAAALSNGDIICFINKNIVANGVTVSTDYLVMKSTNDGESFAEVFKFSNSTDATVRTMSYPNIPVEMDNGEIIASKQIRENGYIGLAFIFSSDKGATWNDSVVVIPADTFTNYNQLPWEVRIAYIGNGKLIAIGRNNIGNVYQLNSGDYGRTWTQYTTNINDCKDNCLFPLYFVAEDILTLYYNDRLSNTIKKRTVSATFIYNNPTLWNESTIIDYTSSRTTDIDSGYITACRIRDFRDETILCLYTTRDHHAGTNDPKKTGVVIVYDSVEAPKTPATKPNLFTNGSFSVWQFGNTINPPANTATYTASQWIFKGTGTNVINRSFTSVYNKRTHSINAAASDTYYRLYQPIVGLSLNNIYTLTARLNPTANTKVRLYLKWTVDGVVQESSTMGKEQTIMGVKTISFTFKKPFSDLGTPVFIGIEMEGKTTVAVINMKLEEGYTNTGINEADDNVETAKCMLYYEELSGTTMSFPATNIGNLMYTMPFSSKIANPVIDIQWMGVSNRARAWQSADVGVVTLTVQADNNYVRFYGTRPASTVPTQYDVDKIIIDARIPPI